MPTLAEIYSAIDSAKRRGMDFVQNPGTSLQQMLGNANDQARGFNQLTGEAAQEAQQGLGGPKVQQLANTMAGAYNPIGMTVYHGTPHVFERFDLSKIGTGEGNQSYGRGLYTAQNPQVATEYRNALTGNHNRDKFIPTIDGKEIDSPVIRSIIQKGGNPEQFIQDMQPKITNLQKNLANASKEETLPGISDYDMAKMDLDRHLKMIDEAKGYIGKQIKNEPLGSLYKVDLPDTHIRKMLDWDEQLKNQPKLVRDLAKKLGMDMNDLGGDLLAKVGKGEEGKQILEKAGIRGIKYLDEKSRFSPYQVEILHKGKSYATSVHPTKGQADQVAKEREAEGFTVKHRMVGTRNFVVFDPNHLTILERNSQPIK
jgi:hypothetical protein